MQPEHWKRIPSETCPTLQHRFVPCTNIQQRTILLHCALLYTYTYAIARGRTSIRCVTALSLKYLRTEFDPVSNFFQSFDSYIFFSVIRIPVCNACKSAEQINQWITYVSKRAWPSWYRLRCWKATGVLDL